MKIFSQGWRCSQIARFVAASAWRNSNDKDKEEYVETYRHYMAFTYATRIKEYNQQRIVIQRISDTSQRIFQ